MAALPKIGCIFAADFRRYKPSNPCHQQKTAKVRSFAGSGLRQTPKQPASLPRAAAAVDVADHLGAERHRRTLRAAIMPRQVTGSTRPAATHHHASRNRLTRPPYKAPPHALMNP